ncbi:MAG: precorrin-4 C(11)-methyltransferase [Lachnospiraceae bacterium]
MIHFVGAGCGAKDLITLRGYEHIKKADVIVYAGSLVNKELLDYNENKAMIYDSSLMTLDEVMSVLIESEKKGLYTVRLHTGDPAIFGAIKEQMDELDKNDLEYDITPGVSAAFGAAASLRAEYTLPDVSQTLIITRMSGKTKVPEKESIRSLASHNATMAIYLSASLSAKLQNELICGGYNENTPVAICVKATWDDEKIFRCTVGNLHDTVEKNNIKKTAVFIVGDSINPSNYAKSRLYAPDFSTEFRMAKEDN